MNGRAATSRRILRRAGLAAAVSLTAALACGGDDVQRLRDLQSQGNYVETLAPLREQLAQQPADPDLNLLYGRALLMTGQAGGAVWPLGRASEDPAYAIEAGLLLGMALLQGGSATDAIAAADRVLKIDPENLDALLLHARARVDAVHNDQAIEEIDALIERNPDDPQLRALRIIPLIRTRRLDEAGQALADLRKMLGDTDLRDPITEAYFCAAEATFVHERGDLDEAAAQWKKCVEQHDGDATVTRGAIKFYHETGKKDDARALLEKGLQHNPRDIELRLALAEMLRSGGDAKAADELMEAAAREFPSVDQWSALADYHVAGGDYRRARTAIERAIEMMPSVPEELRFAYADILVSAGDPDEAEKVAQSLEVPVRRDLLRGRVQLARGDAAGAFGSFEKGLTLWPNNAAARYWAAQAAVALGRFVDAVSQYREAIRANPTGTDAAIELAELQEALGSPELGIEPLRLYLAERPNDVEAWRLSTRLLFESGDTFTGRRSLARLRSIDPRAAAATAAGIRRRSSGAQAAAESLEASDLDLTAPENAELLRALVEARIETGAPARAIERVDAAIAVHGEVPEFHALRGRVLSALGDAVQARAAFERALSLDARHVASLVGLGRLAERSGDAAAALQWYDRARAADPVVAEPALAAAELVAARGERAVAIERFEGVLRVEPLHAGAAGRLAELLEQSGDLDRARDLAQRAVALQGGSEVREQLGRLQVAKGDVQSAVAILRQAVDRDPERASLHYWLGRALSLAGDDAAARVAYGEALARGDSKEDERVRAELAGLGEDAR